MENVNREIEIPGLTDTSIDGAPVKVESVSVYHPAPSAEPIRPEILTGSL